MKTLILVTLVLFCSKSYGQSIPKKCIPITTYDSMLVYIAEGNNAIVQAETYKASAEKKQKEIDRKETVIVQQLELKRKCFDLVDTLRTQISLKDDIIGLQKKTIDKMDRPKKFSVGIVAAYGYGFSKEVKLQPFLGVGVMYKLFQF